MGAVRTLEKNQQNWRHFERHYADSRPSGTPPAAASVVDGRLRRGAGNAPAEMDRCAQTQATHFRREVKTPRDAETQRKREREKEHSERALMDFPSVIVGRLILHLCRHRGRHRLR